MAILAYTKTGAKKDSGIKLEKSVFGLEPNHEILSLAYRSYLANGRSVSATTLKRGEVRGGGKKPWRQKGTGRARVGSSRVPTWRGGGVVFGPSGNENYSINLPTKVRRMAIRHALSAQVADNKVIILETFDCPEGKVKPTLALLKSLEAKGNILLVVSLKDSLVTRATQNIASLQVVSAKYLNVFDVLNADLIVVTEKSLPIIEDWLGEKATKANTKPEPGPKPKAKAEKEATNE